MDSSEVDLSGVHPVRRAETLRRIEVIRKFIAIERPGRADAEHHADLLGIGYNQFLVLVRAWMDNGRASALPGAKRRVRLFHEHQLRRLDPSVERVISDAIENAGAFSRPATILAEVVARCEEAGLPPPTLRAMRPRVDEARRKVSSDQDLRNAVVIGRALTDIPKVDGDGPVEPALLVLSVQTGTRRIIAYELGYPSRPPAIEGVLIATLQDPAARAPRDIRISVPTGFERDRLMVAARAANLDDVIWLSGSPARCDSVTALLGGRLGDLRVAESQMRKKWKLTPALNAKTSGPLPPEEVAAVIAAAVAGHNASRTDQHADGEALCAGDAEMIERLQRALDATSTTP